MHGHIATSTDFGRAKISFMKHSIKKWKEISRKKVFEKFGRKIEKVVYKMPDGKASDFYIKTEGVPVCVLALTKDKKVILAKQYRPGPDEILLELPGGKMEVGETPKKAAERELLEETGFRGKVKLVALAYDCAYSTIIRYCFVATDCKKVSEPKNSANEFTEVELIPLSKFRTLLRSGKMTDIEVGYLGLDSLNLL